MNNNFLDNFGNLLQIFSFMILLQDCNNTDLMQELQKQDSKYFEKILQNQEEMLAILREEYLWKNN